MLADNHVHSQFSWDATHGNMEATCRRALELGVPSIAFTEHADWVRGDEGVFDVQAYFAAIERCRASYPELRIMTGVEMGEPHRYPVAARALLAAGFERTLGSVHAFAWKRELRDASEAGFLRAAEVSGMFRRYLEETLALVKSEMPFQVLAHLDYPKRYWPDGAVYDDSEYEDEFRTVLRAAAKRGLALEINTTRGREPGRYLCPGPRAVRWWREEGGEAVSFGSDTHSPDYLVAGFELAQDVAEAAGFKPTDDPLAFWTR